MVRRNPISHAATGGVTWENADLQIVCLVLFLLTLKLKQITSNSHMQEVYEAEIHIN